jgi:hypothetical protein
MVRAVSELLEYRFLLRLLVRQSDVVKSFPFIGFFRRYSDKVEPPFWWLFFALLIPNPLSYPQYKPWLQAISIKNQ